MSPRRGQALTCKHRMACGCDLHNSNSTLSMIRSVARCHADSMRTREPASARLRNGDTQLDDLMYLVGVGTIRSGDATLLWASVPE